MKWFLALMLSLGMAAVPAFTSNGLRAAEADAAEHKILYRQESIARAEADRSIQSHINGFFGSGGNVIDGNHMDRLWNLSNSILEENTPIPNAASEATNEGGEKKAREDYRSGKLSARQEDTDGHMEWIRQNPFVYDNSKSVEENLARAEKMAQEYMDRYGETYHINTTERQEIRRDIIKKLYGDGAKNKNSEAFLIIGLPASGKSTIAKPIIKANGALKIDSDDVKEQLPEFSNGLLARAVHAESSAVAEELFRMAISHGDNIVFLLVGKTEGTLREKINTLKEAGYKVHLIYLELPLEEAIRRGKIRFKDKGRLVPIDYIRSVGLHPKRNYDKIKTEKGVDDYAAWSSDVTRGSEPRLLESSSRTDPLRWLGRGLDTQSLDAVRTGSDRVSQEERSDTQRTDSDIKQSKHSESQGASSVGEEQSYIYIDNMLFFVYHKMTQSKYICRQCKYGGIICRKLQRNFWWPGGKRSSMPVPSFTKI